MCYQFVGLKRKKREK